MKANLRRAQRGAVAILVAVTMVTLLLMVGLVLDLGHLYVTKNELQNAADACALSGARELSGAIDIDVATGAAVTAGERNRADFQKDAVHVAESEVTFSENPDGPWARAVSPATQYIRCAPHESDLKSVVMWFMQLAGPADWQLSAEAVARRMPGQTLCALPLAMCTKQPDGSDLVVGTWYSGRLRAGSAETGNYDWVRFSGLSGVADLGDIIAGSATCNVGPETVDAEPGMSAGVAQAWNTRFGLYAGKYNDPARFPPDFTGYAYTPVQFDNKGVPICVAGAPSGSWPGPPIPPFGDPFWTSCPGGVLHPAPPGQNAYPDYLTRQIARAPYNPTALLDGNGNPSILPGNPGMSQGHATGQHRRMVYVPVIRCPDWEPNKKNIEVVKYACALMLSPLDDPGADVQLEFRGFREETDACGTTGFPGGSGAPVPALVR